MIYRLLHYLVIAFYVTAPAVALVVDAAVSIRRRRGAPSPGFVMTLSAAVVLGTSLSLIYAIGVRGHVSLGQIFLSIYFAAGLLLALKGLDWIVRRACRLALRKLGRPRLAAVAEAAVRVALLMVLGLPYVMAAVMTYRPKVVPRDDPLSQLTFPFESVRFESIDGVRLSGWWIPAILQGREKPRDFGTKTVIVCHGLAANKSNQLVLSSQLVLGGYNVLIFDFRAHGESAGQLTSLGDLERRDVLGAVRWLRESRAPQAQRIFGVGASMGAAALVVAAADPSPEGQAIEAIAVYGSYDSLGLLTRSIARDRFLKPFDRIIPALGLPMAGAQVGADLAGFQPAEEVTKLWPRPILVVHGEMDEVIPFERGHRLWKMAMLPKQHVWLASDHNGIVTDAAAARAVRAFFDAAESVPIL